MNKSGCWTAETHSQVLHYTSERLWSFVQKNAKLADAEDICANIANLSKRDLNFLTAVHFLLNPKVEDFLDNAALKILNSLSKTSTRERNVFRGAVKGKIDLPATIRLQAASGGDRSLFVSWNRSSHFDLLENRLFKHFLIKTTELARDISGTSLESGEVQEKEFTRWIDDVQHIGSKAQRLLRNVYLKQVGPLNSITPSVIEKTEKTRRYWYSDLTEIALLYHRAFTDSNFLREALTKRFFEPLNWDVLYELYVLFKVLDNVESFGWLIKGFNLIGSSGRAAVVFTRPGEILKIYYQHLPDDMARVSSYGVLMDNYGLSASLRRPDIVLERIRDQDKKFYIIEVKRSNSRQYLADGAYKLLGYLKDFENCMLSPGIKGVLVGWSGLNKQSVADSKDEIIFADYRSLEQGIARIVEEQ